MVKQLLAATAGILLVFAVLLCGCTGSGDSGTVRAENVSGEEGLLVHCGAGMKAPMQVIGEKFTEETGIPVTYNYAGCGQLFAQMELTQKGDVFMPGDMLEFNNAKKNGYVRNEALVAYHIPVIAVPAGNPANITSLEDLAKEGVKVSMGEPDSMALGTIAKNLFNKSGILDEVMKNVVVQRATVNEIVTDITLGNADAAIIWSDLYKPGKMEIIEIPRSQNLIKIIPIGTLTFSDQPENAQKFIDFVASDSGGKAAFEECGYIIYPNSEYADITP
jgi:molybdate transport system substrate-binding protein